MTDRTYPRYIVQDGGKGRTPRWWVFDFKAGRPARNDDGTPAEFATRREAYAWQRTHQERIEEGDLP